MSPALFNVERSLNAARWVTPNVSLSTVETLTRAHHGMSEIVAKLLALRDVHPHGVREFLYPKMQSDLPDPFTLKGMEEAVAFMVHAIIKGQKIALFGDFDVDGATSTALACRFFRSIGIEVPIYIPDRLAEGYGPSTSALQILRNNGADVVIMMDCGTTAHDVIAAGKAMGLSIIILDHHEVEASLPPADHIINPKRCDDTSGLSMLAAVGVTFMFCIGVNRALREVGYYKERAEPSLKELLDLVALGTVCDMVPLTGINRLLVRQGFAQMAATRNEGLKALLVVAGITGTITPHHAGFALGPRINAGGRIYQADLGAKLLSTEDPVEAKNIAWTLQDCNVKRRAMQTTMERQAIAKVEALGLDQYPIILVDDSAWHPGLAGLVAGRLKDKYARPVAVVTYTPNGEGRGSARSVVGVHIAKILMAAREAGLVTKGGGHAMAGGFTMEAAQIDALREFLSDHIRSMETVLAIEMESPPIMETVIDAALTVEGAKPDLVRLIHDHIGPFGPGHAEPVFALPYVRIWMADIVGTSHVRVQLGDAEGGVRLKAIAFRAVGTPVGEALLKASPTQTLHVAGSLALNEWAGRVNAEMHIHDAAFT